MPTRRTLVVLAAINALLIAALGFVLVRGRASAGSWHGTRLEPPLPAQSFQLATRAGPLRAEDLRGRHTILFFGYTRCPDACPTTLAKLTRVYEALPAALTGRLHVVLVTVDPAHDSAERLHEYVGRFDARFLGATGEPAAIAAMTRAYGIHHQAAQHPPETGPAALDGAAHPSHAPTGAPDAATDADPHASHAPAGAPALIDHTAHVLVLDRDGRLALLWGPEITADEMAADLRRLLRE